MENIKKNCEIDLFHFTRFYGLDFLKFPAQLCTMLRKAPKVLVSKCIIIITTQPKTNFVVNRLFLCRIMCYTHTHSGLKLEKSAIARDVSTPRYIALLFASEDKKQHFWKKFNIDGLKASPI